MKKYLIVLCCATIFLPCVSSFPKKLRLGSLFEEDDTCRQAFLASVSAANKLQRTSDDLAKFVSESEVIIDDVFEVRQSACNLLGKGVIGIFGPTERIAAEYVRSMCEAADVPNIVARWDVEPAPLKAINLHPHAAAVSLVFKNLVTDLKWKTYTILYENTEGLVRTSELLKMSNPKGYPVTIRRLGSGPNFHDTLIEVKRSGEENVVIDCSYDVLEELLKQCLQVGILSDRFNVIVTNLDLQTIDLEPYGYSGVNLTGVRMIDVDDPEVQTTFDDHMSRLGLESVSQLRLDAALTYDAVQLFVTAFKKFSDIVEGDAKKLACDGSDSWEFGASLSNYIHTTEIRGLTGLVKVHTDGLRSDFELDVVHLRKTGLKKVGRYNSTGRIDWIRETGFVSAEQAQSLENQTFRIFIALNPPYNMVKESSALEVGNDRYEGFAIDIIHELSKILHFNYTFIEHPPDYGNRQSDGSWTGMLGGIIAEKADLAITDLTITSERENAVDFSMPFMNLGISILYKKPKKASPNVFSFLAPLSWDVWICLTFSWIGVSMWFTLVGRMCPAEWNNPDPCVEDPEELDNQFTLSNSLWFTMGTITQQGSEISPIGASTKVLAAMWGFFCMTLMNSYTANLAAFLVVETTVKPIKSAEDLANLNGEIKYGAKKGGSTHNFFKAATYPTYVKMYKYMEDNADEVLTESNEEGRDKVLDDNQNYAFLMESSSIQYIQQRECNVTQIGGLLDTKSYGIAMRKNYKYRGAINTAVLQLQEEGIISDLRKKWWEEKRDGGRCNVVATKQAVATHLTIDHVGGVFWFLGIAVAISTLITFWEFLWDVGWNARKQKSSFRNELMEEMRFVLKCKGQVKLSRRARSSSQTTQQSEGQTTPPYGAGLTVVKNRLTV